MTKMKWLSDMNINCIQVEEDAEFGGWLLITLSLSCYVQPSHCSFRRWFVTTLCCKSWAGVESSVGNHSTLWLTLGGVVLGATCSLVGGFFRVSPLRLFGVGNVPAGLSTPAEVWIYLSSGWWQKYHSSVIDFGGQLRRPHPQISFWYE